MENLCTVNSMKYCLRAKDALFLANHYAKDNITNAELDTCIARLANISDTPFYDGNRETGQMAIKQTKTSEIKYSSA